ncbi:PadR family transcriptional regulator [Mycetocola saprophilus]|uniref:PadR family transcriptional regulator n=1 Tax=Mycetocola saprophilus TaxID=76636 RepID=UPI000689EF64|nr:PadR family transcriptional regulator [Mycetocola saprophilus]
MVAEVTLKPIEIAALGLLLERPMHPYEMYQIATQRREDTVVKVSPGSLYRAVYALEQKEYARVAQVEREGARPERTLFEITDAGRERLYADVAELLRTPQIERPSVLQALSEAHVLPVEQVIELLSERLVEMRARVVRIRAEVAAVTALNVPEMYWINVPYMLTMAEAEITWVVAQIERLRAGELSWQDSRTPEEKAQTAERKARKHAPNP